MRRTLFLLDGMALVYRAHFALIRRPIFTSKGVNTSALFGFVQTLLEIRDGRGPTHWGVAFDTEAPTRRHREYPEYKAQRQEMPEELSQALPQVRRLAEAFRLPWLAVEGFEADDIIGTLVGRAEVEGFESYMVTPDKDFGQLVTSRTRWYRPSRQGSEPEVLGPAEICQRWGIASPRQVIDLLGLMGDASDNIPGVPGIGEKTAARLVSQFGSVEGVYERLGEVPERWRRALELHRAQAQLSKHLATIDCEVPIEVSWEQLARQEPDAAALKSLLIEFEFNSIGKRLFGEDFRAGRGYEGELRLTAADGGLAREPGVRDSASDSTVGVRGVAAATRVELRTLEAVKPRYRVIRSSREREQLVDELGRAGCVGVAVGHDGGELRNARPTGMAVCVQPGTAWWLPFGGEAQRGLGTMELLRSVVEDIRLQKVGHDVKSDLALLCGLGVKGRGEWFDGMIAHALAEPELRHHLGYVAESLLGYTPMREGGDTLSSELGLDLEGGMGAGAAAMERADLALQLQALLEPRLRERGQERVFREIEMPLVPVLVGMEHEGIRVEASVLEEFAGRLRREMETLESSIHRLAGGPFNVNSPKQLGEVLFERLRLVGKPRKTRTGQYATDEATLLALAGEHEIVRRLLEHRECSKLKSTYADALPASIDPRTGRVHTTYHQLQTATGRLSSQNPNLQNIPIRTGLGREIRRAFVARGEGWQLLSADYSQIELRIIAALSREAALLDALRKGEDVHITTAARVFGVEPADVTSEMRSQAKMVNYSIAYGISAFGLAQRLGIPRKLAGELIDQYYAQFPGIRRLMEATLEGCRERGYVETVAGRRRYVRDINSANATVRGAAERNAINAPIQGTAADLIKLAMVGIHGDLERGGFQTRMLLQVHDELVFDLFEPEREEVARLVRERMRSAMALDVPIEVELGMGRTWLEAH
jgi:DNA polymerase I